LDQSINISEYVYSISEHVALLFYKIRFFFFVQTKILLDLKQFSSSVARSEQIYINLSVFVNE